MNIQGKSNLAILLVVMVVAALLLAYGVAAQGPLGGAHNYDFAKRGLKDEARVRIAPNNTGGDLAIMCPLTASGSYHRHSCPPPRPL